MRERTPPPLQFLRPPSSYLAGGSGSGPAFALLFAPAILGSKFHFISFHALAHLHARLLLEAGLPASWTVPFAGIPLSE